MALQSILSLAFQLVWLVVYGIALFKYHESRKVFLPLVPLAGHCALFVWLVCTQSEHWIGYWWLLLIYAIAACLSVMLMFAYCYAEKYRVVMAAGVVFVVSIVALTLLPVELGAPIVGIVANLALSGWYVWKLDRYYLNTVAIGKTLGNIGLFLSITPTEPLRWLWWLLYALVLALDAAVFGVLLYRRYHRGQEGDER